METTQVALEGADVRLPCQGLLPFVRGAWVRNGTRIKTSGRFTVAEDHLAIAAVQEQDAGVYECHARAPVLRYAHTARVTLLLANGTATLITHYAITTQPQPSVLPTPPLCTRPLEDTLEEEEEDPGPPDCPQPYAPSSLQPLRHGRRGDGKTWHRARVQCHRQLGDLVKVHDAAFMLALIQFLRVKGLTGTSFWAGGLRTGAKKWSWVDGTSVDLEEPHWYLTPIGLPEDIPLTRKEGEATGKKDTPGRKAFRPSILNLGERLTPVPAGSAKGTRPKISAGSPTRRRRRRPKKDPQRRTARGLAGPDDVTVIDDVVVDDETTVVDDVEYDAMPLVDEDLEEDVVLTDDDVDADDDFAWTDDVDLYDDVTLPDGPINTWDPLPAEAPPTDALERDLRGASGSGLLLFGPGRQRASSDPLMALSHQRAACMWADLGHFLASCSVLHNLVAICEYTPEEI
ncbi:uncharacterized protein LOC122262594 [Penaeus japonicus]|uniref:uncharacterized protein LOC122262594 n=1 Tax=Penaeus japonicus TaxID=27405 RepID=UPI001C71569B|nr:uncharacterized protein LOC122262594 [Penaeus japonicus]